MLPLFLLEEKDMNLNRKIDMQERTIKNLQEKNEKLRSENKALRTENAQLADKNQHYEQIVGSVDTLRSEWNARIQEALEYRKQYKDAVFAVRKIRKEYEKKFNQLNRQFKV